MKIQFADEIYKRFWTAFDWIYPPVCAGCQEPGYRLCLKCQQSIHFITGRICPRCGGKLPQGRDQCAKCRENPPPYTAMRNLATYEGVVRECIHALKYENNQSLAELFSGWLAAFVNEEGWEIDMVAAVPLSRQRQKERGYNQAERIARPLAMRLGIRYNPFAIIRTRDTVSQVGLSAEARRLNVEGAFEALPELVAGKKVLLFDDVMTTGSTLEACSSALRESGTQAVYCLTIGRFVLRNNVSFSNRHPV